MPACHQVGPQRLEVVDLAVEDDPDRAVLVRHRLPAGRTQVNDAEPSVRQADGPIAVDAGVIRPAMGQHGVHPLQHRALDRPRRVEVQFPADPAHVSPALDTVSRPDEADAYPALASAPWSFPSGASMAATHRPAHQLRAPSTSIAKPSNGRSAEDTQYNVFTNRTCSFG